MRDRSVENGALNRQQQRHLDHGSDEVQLLTRKDPAQGAAAAQGRVALETLGGGNPRRPFVEFGSHLYYLRDATCIIAHRCMHYNDILPRFSFIIF